MEQLKVAEYEIEYTGGGLSVAYGVYTNGEGFSLGYENIVIYDEDGRHEQTADDPAQWYEDHLVDDLGCEADIYIDTLNQIWIKERESHGVEWLIKCYDIFGDHVKELSL